MKLATDLVVEVPVASPTDEGSSIGTEEQVQLLQSLAETLFKIPRKLGSYFFVSRKLFESVRHKHPASKDKRFEEWCEIFADFNLYPIPSKRFASFLKREKRNESSGDVVILGIKPNSTEKKRSPPLRKSYVIYISTAEERALAFPEVEKDGMPNGNVIDIWDLYTRGVIVDEKGEEQVFTKDSVGIHAILDYFDSPNVTFLTINPSQDSLRRIGKEIPYRAIINGLFN